MKMGSPHLSFENITDLAIGDLADDEMTKHLKACGQCELEMSRTRQLVDLMRTDRTEDAPAFALTAILRSFDEYRPEMAAEPPTIGGRLRAILRLDSAKLGPAYGFRSVGTANSRQLLFSIDNGSLDIRITPAGSQWVISGQVLGQITGGTVFLEDEKVNLEIQIDSSGQFSLPPVENGTYRLRLNSESFDVEVPDLEVG